jgi:hypothetical protein
VRLGLRRFMVMADFPSLKSLDFAALHKSESDAVDGSSTWHFSAKEVGAALKAPTIRRSYHANGFDNGLDTAKSVFRVYGVDPSGQVVVRRQLKRRQVIGFFPEVATMLDRDRGLCVVTSLVARAGHGRRTMPDAQSHTPSVHPPADLNNQCDPCSPCRVWRHRTGRT